MVKYHGGKGRLHQWVISHFPAAHTTYVEPFGGAASVLLNKDVSSVEVYNELEPDMFNLMYTLKHNYAVFKNRVEQYEYSKPVFLSEKTRWLARDFADELDRAVCFYVVKRMSRGGLCQRFSWSDRTYSTGPAEEHCWRTSLNNLLPVWSRLQNVTLLNQNAFDVLPAYLDNPDSLIYLDPPYLTSTRVYKKAYSHEFDKKDHERLASLLRPARAKILLSGYDSPEYDRWFSGWRKAVKNVANHSSQNNGKSKVRKQEVLWMNYPLSESM